jgi:pimeloyl-ACP methyl ester carboxylesterase
MPTISVNGTHLYYEDTGPGSTGQTVVFSHGLLWNTELFSPQIAALRGRYRCVAWDHRGQGRSAADHRHCIGMELVWQDAVALLEKLDPGAVHFCGLSMGGFVGMRIAARRPELLRSLMLLETSADPEPEENLPRYRLLTRATRLLGPGAVASRVLPILFGKTFVNDPARAQERARFVELLRARRDIWKAVNGVIDRAGVLDELRRIAVPTLVLVGDEDVATTPAKARRIRERIQGAQLVEIPRAGHSSSVEQPAAVTAAIERFLAELDVTPA